jgi:hypothetical protein
MMEIVKLVIAVTSAVLAVASFVIARRADVRAKKSESIKQLLGERESVAFGALQILRDGLPTEPKDRLLVIAALMQACVFEGSDRTRALLYRVLEVNRIKLRDELRSALQVIRDTFDSMDRYQFVKEELDLDRGRRRIAAVEKVINAP